MPHKKVALTDSYMINMEEIFLEYYPALCHFASKFLPDTCDAEDVVQEVFVSFIEKKSRFKSTLHVQNSLYLSVRNACVSWLRKHTARTRRTLDYLMYLDPESEEAMISTEIYRRLAVSIDSLPNACRKIIEMSYLQGLDNEEIARKLNISIHTVKAQKARGKGLLKDKLKDLYPLFLLFFNIWE